MTEQENNKIENEITSIFYEDNKYTNYAIWLLGIGLLISLIYNLIRTLPILIDNICQEIIIIDYSN